MLAIFDRMRIESDDVRDWFAKQLRSQTAQDQQVNRERRAEINRQLSLVIQQHNQLVNMRLNEEINSDTYAAKDTELRDREANLKLQLDACDLGRLETAEIAIKAFELSQSLRSKWLTADYSVERRYLEIVFLNFVLDDITLVPTMRKPFDVVAEGLLVSSSRGDPRRYFTYEMAF